MRQKFCAVQCERSCLADYVVVNLFVVGKFHNFSKLIRIRKMSSENLSGTLHRCNNCLSPDHFFIDCLEPKNSENRRLTARDDRWAKGYGEKSLLEQMKRSNWKDEGKKMNVWFLKSLLEKKYCLLEQNWMQFQELPNLKVDPNGRIEEKNKLLKYRTLVLDIKEEVSSLINAAKGRAFVWTPGDDDAGVNLSLFWTKVDQLAEIRETLFQGILSKAKIIELVEREAQAVVECSGSVSKLSEEVLTGLETIGIASATQHAIRLNNYQNSLRKIRDEMATMESNLERIKRRKVRCEVLVGRVQDSRLSMLKTENGILKAIIRSLNQELSEKKTCCPICEETEPQIRLVTVEGNCKHCICKNCWLGLDWVAPNLWEAREIQVCPFCREEIIMPACMEICLL